ncbi:MAG: methyltransferase domain-containing protein [Clostridiales bacterium]|jgi:trans-aconitate 2-methyltransferase|nr:methyltransferase domain-containing protein [Clostridiales bacterium]
MKDWNPDKYLLFENERTQPAIDLVEKISLSNPKKIIDIGCGPGNSTRILANKWPNCNVVGLDSSKSMIEKAKSDYPNQTWIHERAENIADDKEYSLVFSNASLQWMDNPEILIPKLWNAVEDNGAFAAQIPNFENMPVNFAINDALKKEKWNNRIKSNIWNKQHEINYYYEILNKYAGEITLWETHYYHIMESMKGIIDFVRSTALRPYLEQLVTEDEKRELENEILDECKKRYNEQSNNKVLFPFQRMFIIAYKK